MDEICGKAEAAERDQLVISEERKANFEKEKKQVEDMQAKALEKVGETKKRVAVSDNSSGEPEKKEKRARRSGTEAIAYLRRNLQGIPNQARRITNKKREAVCPSKASRANDTATDPTTRASARYVC